MLFLSRSPVPGCTAAAHISRDRIHSFVQMSHISIALWSSLTFASEARRSELRYDFGTWTDVYRMCEHYSIKSGCNRAPVPLGTTTATSKFTPVRLFAFIGICSPFGAHSNWSDGSRGEWLLPLFEFNLSLASACYIVWWINSVLHLFFYG